MEDERRTLAEMMQSVETGLAELRKQESESRGFVEAERGRLVKEQERIDAERKYLMDTLEQEKLTFVTMRETFEGQRLEALKSFEAERRLLATEKIRIDRTKEDMARLNEAAVQHKLDEERAADDLRAQMERQAVEMREKHQDMVRTELKVRLEQQRVDVERLRMEAERSLVDEKKQDAQRLFDESRKLFEAAGLLRRFAVPKKQRGAPTNAST